MNYPAGQTDKRHRIGLKRWSAWAPGLESRGAWESWSRSPVEILETAAPKLSFLPANIRRRMSQLDRMALYCAFACVDAEHRSDVRTVFASRHGESQTTQELLNCLAQNEMLSPMSFSLSVHNSGSGIYSIVTKSHAPSTAVAAGSRTFFAAFLEAAAQLNAEPEKGDVLLVMGDELVPQMFRTAVHEKMAPYACAFLLGEAANEESQLEWQLNSSPEYLNCAVDFPPALGFVGWLLSEERDYSCSIQSQEWRFWKHNSLATNFVEQGA